MTPFELPPQSPEERDYRLMVLEAREDARELDTLDADRAFEKSDAPAWWIQAPLASKQVVNRMMLERIEYRMADCWLWTGTKAFGYGVLSTRQLADKRLRVRAHRWAYEYFIGPVPTGMQLDHLCRNRACCNPGHLEPVTNRENVLRGVGPSAQNARKTHCGKGHPLSGDNAYIDPKGRRSCRICNRDAKRRRRQEDPAVAERDRERCRRWKKATGYKPPARVRDGSQS